MSVSGAGSKLRWVIIYIDIFKVVVMLQHDSGQGY
jgi:hypothetical protein